MRARFVRHEGDASRTGRFEALQVDAYRWLFISGFLAFMTMQMGGIARAWLAFEITGSNSGLGGVMMMFGLASIVAMPTGGVLADRFAKRGVLVVAGLMQATTPLALAVAVVTDSAAYWMLLAAGLVQGAAISILGPARLGAVAEVVDRQLLTNAVFLSMGSVQCCRVVGPAVAGVLIGVAFFGLAGVFFTTAGLALASVLMVLRLPRGAKPEPSGRSALGDVLDGVRFVRADREILHLLLMSFAVVLVGFPHIAFLPVIAERIYEAGSAGFGLLTTAGAVGALVATIALANLHRSRLKLFQGRSAAVFGVSLAVFALMPTFVAAMAIFAVVGASSSAFQALNNSLVLSSAPVEYHGRVQSLLMFSYAGFSVISLPFGVLADAAGIRPTVLGMGLAVFAVTVVFRRLEPRAKPEADRL